jgi:hypothetical protein
MSSCKLHIPTTLLSHPKGEDPCCPPGEETSLIPAAPGAANLQTIVPVCFGSLRVPSGRSCRSLPGAQAGITKKYRRITKDNEESAAMFEHESPRFFGIRAQRKKSSADFVSSPRPEEGRGAGGSYQLQKSRRAQYKVFHVKHPFAHSNHAALLLPRPVPCALVPLRNLALIGETAGQPPAGSRTGRSWPGFPWEYSFRNRFASLRSPRRSTPSPGSARCDITLVSATFPDATGPEIMGFNEEPPGQAAAPRPSSALAAAGGSFANPLWERSPGQLVN